jgi:spore maturation protein CgeB
MRFLVVNTDYPDFLLWFYAQHPGLENRSYAEQIRSRYQSLYGVADFYSKNLQALGHEAEDVYANNEFLQKAWAATRGMVYEPVASVPAVSALQRVRKVAGKTPARHLMPYMRSWLYRKQTLPRWSYDILKAQIEQYRPDVFLNQAVDSLSGQFVREIKPFVRFIIGQHAATVLSENEDYSGYDLMISSFPPTVEWLKSKGLHAYLSRLGFDPRVLSCLSPCEKKSDLTFAGNFFAVHSSRRAWLEELCRQFPQMKIWSPVREQIPPTSPLRNHYEGTAWGRDMYQVLHSSKITLNHHGDVAPYANNMRLFEATGVGACLVTDWKRNLGEMFEVGKEVIAYRSLEECAELVRYYLTHDGAREVIARAGQARTLREHTYFHRMQELVGLVEQHV